MLKVEIDSPKSTSTLVGEIKVGTLFFGTAVHSQAPRLHLKLQNGAIVNMETFGLWAGHNKDTWIYHYEEVTDALLTTRNRINLDNTIRTSSLLDSYFPDIKKSVDTKETD